MVMGRCSTIGSSALSAVAGRRLTTAIDVPKINKAGNQLGHKGQGEQKRVEACVCPGVSGNGNEQRGTHHGCDQQRPPREVIGPAPDPLAPERGWLSKAVYGIWRVNPPFQRFTHDSVES